MTLRSWFRSRVRLVQQMEAAECGIASLTMVADYLGARHSLPQVRSACGSSRDGNSALELLRGARQLGLEGRGVKVKVELLPQLRKPAILHWHGSHFVVLEGTDGTHAMLADPASGKRRVPLADVERALSGTALELWRGPGFRRTRRVSNSRATYMAALLKHKLAMAFVLVAGVAEQVLAVVAPAADQFLVDQVVAPVRQTWLLPVLAVLCFCALAQFVLERLHGVGQVLLNTTLGIQLCRQIAERMVRLPLPFLESRSHGDLLSRVHLQNSLQGLISATAKGVLDLVFAALLSLLLVAYDSRLGALSLGFSALNVVIIRLCRRIMEQRASAEVAAAARTESALVEATSALEMIKGFGAENQMARRYGARVRERARLGIESSRFSLALDGAMSLLGTLMQSAILWFGGQRVIDGEMTIGVFMGFLAIRSVLAGPIGSLVQLAESWLRVGGTLDRSDDILCEPTARSGSHVASAISGRLVAHGLGFRYGSGGRWLFRNVNLCIEPGQHVAIIGPSGHGKSTLAKLLAGLLEPSEGHVTLDGIDIRDYDREALARSLGVVLQVPLIFEGSVLDAVRLRDPSASPAAVVEAAELSAFDRVVARMPAGYHSRVEANGANLSGGERQRLAIAQALLGRPQLLFLDEGTCSLDAATEERVLDSLDRLPATVVSVAHRESVIVRAQRVIRVEAGNVAEHAAGPPRPASPRSRSLAAGAVPQRPHLKPAFHSSELTS